MAYGHARCVRCIYRYAGYASESYGDEYIGPSSAASGVDGERSQQELGSGAMIAADDPASHPHVRERLDKWAEVCSGQDARKVLMGGTSAYGSSLGFGTRNGFVEHYWYTLPHDAYGQTFETVAHRDYVYVNTSSPSAHLMHPALMLGEENEEYALPSIPPVASPHLTALGATWQVRRGVVIGLAHLPHHLPWYGRPTSPPLVPRGRYAAAWSSDWRTTNPRSSGKGGTWDAEAQAQGGAARYGPIASFPYRYLMSSLRALQMRVSYMLASNVVVTPALYAYMALELDRSAADAPDAWCFLASTRFRYLEHRNWQPGEVGNLERWLHQRDEPYSTPGGVVTFADARVSQTPAPPTSNGSWYSAADSAHDWIARTAPRGVIGFTIDPTFATAVGNPLVEGWLKVTIFDVFAGKLQVTQAHQPSAADGAPRLVGEHTTSGGTALRTFTVAFSSLPVREDGSPLPFDLEVRATDVAGSAQPLVLSMIRIIKRPLDTPPAPPASPPAPPPSPTTPPPAPPLTPGARVVTVHKTVVEMVAAGSVADYDAGVRDTLAGRFAVLAGVDASAVEVTVQAASVIITVAITVADNAAAAALVTSVSEQLGDASAASAFTGLSISSAPRVAAVAEAVVVASEPPLPSSPPPQMPPDERGRLIAIVVPPITVLTCLCTLIAVYLCQKRKKKSSTTLKAPATQKV